MAKKQATKPTAQEESKNLTDAVCAFAVAYGEEMNYLQKATTSRTGILTQRINPNIEPLAGNTSHFGLLTDGYYVAYKEQNSTEMVAYKITCDVVQDSALDTYTVDASNVGDGLVFSLIPNTSIGLYEMKEAL